MIPLLGVVAPFFLGRQMFKRRFLTVTGVIIVFTVVISVSCGDIVQQRLDQSYTNIVSFMKGENLNSSIGQRFLMWDIAIKMFSKNPLLGSGLGDFRITSYNVCYTKLLRMPPTGPCWPVCSVGSPRPVTSMPSRH